MSLIINNNGKPCTTSRLVAATFGKRHDRVLQTIRELNVPKEFTEHNFVEGSYLDANNQKRPEYIITKDGFTFLAMGFTGKKASKFKIEYINAFNRMEDALKSGFRIPQTFSEALRELANSKEAEEKTNLQLQAAKNIIEDNKPKVVFAESVTGSGNSILVRQFAKDLSDDNFRIGQNRLFEWFRTNKYLNSGNEPYQNYIEQGLFEVITRVIGSGTETFTSKTTKITGKGQIYFAKKIKTQNLQLN